jgi:hypothetical protein
MILKDKAIIGGALRDHPGNNLFRGPRIIDGDRQAPRISRE